MRADILKDLTARLNRDFKFKVSGDWLRGGTCPSCSKKELYTHAETPWVLRCGRLNRCGYERHVKDLYPEIFANFNKRYKPTPAKPNATADAYMELARGFKTREIKGWYRQEKFWHPHGDKGTATVRFDIDRVGGIFMERLIEPVIITQEDGSRDRRKAHFGGTHKGLWWAPPTLKIEDGDTVWIVEGCLDAIALSFHGIKAVAMLSCYNYPETRLSEHAEKDVTWVFALDNDPAGKSSTKKWVKKARAAGLTVKAAQIPEGKVGVKTDWNDLHQQDRLSDTDQALYLHHGALLIAESPLAKAELIWEHSQKPVFAFTFDNRLFWFKVNVPKFVETEMELEAEDPDMSEEERRQKALDAASSLSEMCNCYPRFLYFLAHEATGESWYYARISFPNGRLPIKTTFTGAQIASAAEFKKRLLSAAPGGLFTGGGGQLNWIVRNNLNAIKQVKTIDYVGYSADHKTYVFPDFALAKGKIYEANEEDYIEIDKLSIKTLSHGFTFKIGQAHDYDPSWPELVYAAFGVKGLAALTFWFGSLFAEQIRADQKSYPFMEIVGKPGSGKTTLIEFMWKLFGLEDTEGFDPSKSTFASIRRKFAQVSNLPIVLLEGDRTQESKYKSFDFNALKDLYNGRAFGERGVKNGGNETYAPKFKAAIVIAQNATVQADDAVLERIVHLDFDKSAHSLSTRTAADRLNALPVEKLSHFLIAAIREEQKVLDHVRAKARIYEDQLLTHPKIKNFRTAKNHGQMMALGDEMIRITGLSNAHREELLSCFENLATERELALGSDHPTLETFWELYHYLEPQLNHSKDNKHIAINLNGMVKIAFQEKQQMPALTELKPLLKNSRTHKFIGVKTVNSRLADHNDYIKPSQKCWVFERQGGA